MTETTAFRIASMIKSFTVLAILKLRDHGKLSREDPVPKWIPEFVNIELPTRDSAPLKIRQLMSHSAGLPEDNPWADQQLAAREVDLTQWLRQWILFSTPRPVRRTSVREMSRAGGRRRTLTARRVDEQLQDVDTRIWLWLAHRDRLPLRAHRLA